MCCVDIRALLTAVKLDSCGSSSSVSYSCLCKKIICPEFLFQLSLKQNNNMFMTFVKDTQTGIIPDYSMHSSSVYPSQWLHFHLYLRRCFTFIIAIPYYLHSFLDICYFDLLYFHIFIPQPYILFPFYKNKESSVLFLSSLLDLSHSINSMTSFFILYFLFPFVLILIKPI